MTSEMLPNMQIRIAGNKQGYTAKCEHLYSSLSVLVKGMLEQALQQKYADAVCHIADMQMQHISMTCQLHAITTSEALLHVRLL